MIDVSRILTLFTTTLDILIVTIFCYIALKIVLKSQKHVLIINALLIFFLLFVFSNLLELEATTSILRMIYSWGIVIIVIIFQTEIRESLESIGKFGDIFRKQSQKISFLEELADAVFEMGETKTGALITLVNSQSFNSYSKNAVEINADFSGLLLKTIFNKEAPIHDGAVLIQKGVITHASVYFPISLEVDLDKSKGTRHRAAMTISDLTDAIAIVVSEETGAVSICNEKRIYSDLNRDEFIAIIKEKMNKGDNNDED